MNTAIIIHSCDKYNYVLSDFFKCFDYFKRHLEQLGLPIWLTSENIDCSQYCQNIITGDGEWSDRLIKAIGTLPDSIENIILIQEDLFFTQMELNGIESAIKFHNMFGIDITKMGAFYEFNLEATGIKCGGYPVWKQNAGHYVMSHQPIAIFNRKFLLRTLVAEPRDPWHHECKTTEEINQGVYGPVKVFAIGNIYNPNKSDIMRSHHAIRKGVFYPL